MIKLWGANITYWIIGVVVLLIVSNMLSFNLGQYIGRGDGARKVTNVQLTEQKKTDDKAHKDFERVDHATPYTGSRDERFNWLLGNAGRSF